MSGEGGGWLGQRVSQLHDSTKKYDPIGHYAVEWPLKIADYSVKKSSEGLARAARKAGVNDHLPDMVEKKAGENQGDFGAAAVRHVGSAASIYGGLSALGGEAGAAGGAAGGETGALGYGLEGTAGYTVPSAGGAGAGSYGGGTALGYGLDGGGYATPQAGGLDGASTGIYSEANGMGGSTAVDTGSYGQGNSLMQSLNQTQMPNSGKQGQQQQQARPVNLGNGSLIQALAQLVAQNQQQSNGGNGPQASFRQATSSQNYPLLQSLLKFDNQGSY